MTIKASIFTAFILAVSVTSCKKDLEPQESSVAASQPAAVANPATPLAATAAQPQQMQAQPQQMQVQPQQMQQVQATAPGMNPPHGQPGHRCDIAVGSPLSQPVKSATTSNITTSNGTSIQKITPGVPMANGAAPSTPKTAQGMNPPHGQPGHRCDIAVGTPLSQPVKTTSVQNANTNGEPVTITPAVISSDGKVTPGSGVKVTTTSAPAILQDPNNKPASSK